MGLRSIILRLLLYTAVCWIHLFKIQIKCNFHDFAQVLLDLCIPQMGYVVCIQKMYLTPSSTMHTCNSVLCHKLMHRTMRPQIAYNFVLVCCSNIPTTTSYANMHRSRSSWYSNTPLGCSCKEICMQINLYVVENTACMHIRVVNIRIIRNDLRCTMQLYYYAYSNSYA